MAARRIFSHLANARFPQNPLHVVTREFHPCPNSFPRDYEKYTRRFQTFAKTGIPIEHAADNESCSSNPDSGAVELIPNSINDEPSVTHRVTSNLKISARHDLVMIYTCKVCDTRSMKTVCRESYDKGVVVTRCDGCNNLHLIADRLGWFGEPGSVEEFLAARGEEVKKGCSDTLNLTFEDLAGKKKPED